MITRRVVASIRHLSPCRTNLRQSRIRPIHTTHRISNAAAPGTSATKRPDPFTLVAPHLQEIRTSLLSLLESGHPHLSEITKYYFMHPSKHVRPLIVLLFSQATNGMGRLWQQRYWESTHENAGGRAHELDIPMTRPDVLNDWNPKQPSSTAQFTSDAFPLRLDAPHRPPTLSYDGPNPSDESFVHTRHLCSPPVVLPTQIRLAQIVEMMHTASLLHDDVIDESALRRGSPSAPASFGNKLSILGGNFVLGRASAALSRLGDAEVTDLIASVLSNLVEGEILQMKDVKTNGSVAVTEQGHTDRCKEAWNIYMQKTYLKTASLMAKGARAAVVLGGCKEGDIEREIAYAYGRNLGIAFQLVDDILDYESVDATLGKPGGADLQLGLTTGPALYAWEEHPEMGELIQRKFEKTGDVEKARDYVARSSALQRTKDLAREYAEKAKEVLGQLPDSEAKGALEVLTEKVIGRKS